MGETRKWGTQKKGVESDRKIKGKRTKTSARTICRGTFLIQLIGRKKKSKKVFKARENVDGKGPTVKAVHQKKRRQGEWVVTVMPTGQAKAWVNDRGFRSRIC